MNGAIMMALLACVCVCACVETVSAHPSPDWNVGVDQTRNGGAAVRAEAQKKWDVSKDGKVQAEVHGHWERTYGGANNGQRDHGAGASIGGQW